MSEQDPPNEIHDTADMTPDAEQSFAAISDAIDALGDDETGPDDETSTVAEEASSTEEATADGEDVDESDDDSDAKLITLDDGQAVALEELKQGYFRSEDYAHKTKALAQERQAVDSLREQYDQHAQSLNTAYQHFTEFLAGLIPPEPDLSLAQNDPGAYQYHLALRQSAIAEIEKVYAASEQANATTQKASDEDIARFKSAEDAKLLEAMPMLKDPSRRLAFDATNKKTAVDFGFSEQEIDLTADHRILQLVHYARLGKIAEQNRKKASRRVAEKPRKGTQSTPATSKPTRNREAMKRLAKTGAFEDAMAVDFD